MLGEGWEAKMKRLGASQVAARLVR
jgi:hypothetical protein